MPSMPKVRDSSGTIGTTCLPICLSRTSVDRIRTNAIVVEIARSAVPSSWVLKFSSGGHGQRLRRAPAAHRQPAAERLAALAQVGHLRRVLRRLVEGLLGDLLVGELQPEAVPEGVQRLVGHLLLLVGDVLALAGRAHPVALDRLGEDHRRAALGAHRLGVGRVDLRRVVAAAVERPDVGVRPVLDALGQLGVGAEEVLAHVGAVARLERLVLAVDALVHAALEQPVVVGREQRVPLVAPDHLEHVPAGAAEDRLELVDDLAVAAHRARRGAAGCS